MLLGYSTQKCVLEYKEVKSVIQMCWCMEFILYYADKIGTSNNIMKVIDKNNQVSEEKIKITLRGKNSNKSPNIIVGYLDFFQWMQG